MVAVMEKDSSKVKTAIVNHKPELDLFWLYARAATSRDPEELRDLSFSDCDPIRRRVAANPATPPEVLEWLAVDWHPPVRAALAENPRTSKEILSKLVKDKDREVRLAFAKELAFRPYEIKGLLEVLARDSEKDIREKAKEALASLKADNVVAHQAKEKRPFNKTA